MNRIIRAFTDAHVALIRITHGRVGARMGTMTFCILTTTGRKSGVERHNPLASFPHDDGLVVIASAGGSDADPAWYRNLVANPDVRVEVDGVDRVEDDGAGLADPPHAAAARASTTTHAPKRRLPLRSRCATRLWAQRRHRSTGASSVRWRESRWMAPQYAQ